MERDAYIEQNLIDTILERPYGFKINGKSFFLYQPSMGKVFLTLRILEDSGISEQQISENPYKTALEYVEKHTDDACRILSYHTTNNKSIIFDNDKIEKKMQFFKKNLTQEELSNLFILSLTFDNVKTFIRYLGIDKEKESMSKVMKAKEDKGNNLTFGGKSIYGTLIDALCERYHWTMDYIVWGISFSNIQMLMEDKITSVYLTDEEKKKCRVTNEREFVSGDDIKNIALIHSL